MKQILDRSITIYVNTDLNVTLHYVDTPAAALVNLGCVNPNIPFYQAVPNYGRKELLEHIAGLGYAEVNLFETQFYYYNVDSHRYVITVFSSHNTSCVNTRVIDITADKVLAEDVFNMSINNQKEINKIVDSYVKKFIAC